jgi:hypothetical protein
MSEDLSGQEGMVGAEVPDKRRPQRGEFRSHPTPGPVEPRRRDPACHARALRAWLAPRWPQTSVATVASLMPASSSNLWTRFASRARS